MLNIMVGSKSNSVLSLHKLFSYKWGKNTTGTLENFTFLSFFNFGALWI